MRTYFLQQVVRELSEYVCHHGITCIMTLVKKCYCIAGNFRGTKFSMITSFQLFANTFSRYKLFHPNFEVFIFEDTSKSLKSLSLEIFQLYGMLTCVSIQIYGYPVCPLIHTLYLGLKQIVVFVFEYSVVTTNRIYSNIVLQ